MSGTDVTLGAEDLTRILRGLDQLTDRDVSAVLGRSARELVKGGLMQRHFQAMSGQWAPNSPETLKRKARYGSGNRPWIDSGDAKMALSDPKAEAMIIRSSGKKRYLAIAIRKVVNGQNVYNIVQRGKFAGVKETATGKEFSASEIHERNATDKRAYVGSVLAGNRASYRSWRGEMHKLGRLQKGIKGNRMSKNPRPLVEPISGDDEIAAQVIERQLEITLQKRGLM